MIYSTFSIVCRLTWQSELLVKNVSSKDYGIYDCIAQNEMGLERYSIYLNVTSRPDPPSYLKILNVTYNSVNLTWTSGKKLLQFVNCSLVEFLKNLRALNRTIYSNSERSEQLLVAECIFNFFLEVSYT